MTTYHSQDMSFTAATFTFKCNLRADIHVHIRTEKDCCEYFLCVIFHPLAHAKIFVLHTNTLIIPLKSLLWYGTILLGSVYYIFNHTNLNTKDGFHPTQILYNKNLLLYPIILILTFTHRLVVSHHNALNCSLISLLCIIFLCEYM